MLTIGNIPTLGQGEPEPATATPEYTPEQEKTIERILELEKKLADLKETRSRRFWGAIAGIAAASTAIVTILTFATRRK